MAFQCVCLRYCLVWRGEEWVRVADVERLVAGLKGLPLWQRGSP